LRSEAGGKKLKSEAAQTSFIFRLPESIIIESLLMCSARELAKIDTVCKRIRSKHANGTDLTLTDYAARIRCCRNGWKLRQQCSWKQTLQEQRVWLVVDTSASMGETFMDTKTKKAVSRLDVAIKHLSEEVLPKLAAGQEFQLVRFSKSVIQEGVCEANKETIAEAIEKLSKWTPDGSTEIYTALSCAYADSKVRHVHLLSDGDARDHDKLLRKTREWSQGGLIPCNTVSIFAHGRCRELMQEIAEESQGTTTCYTAEPNFFVGQHA